MSESQDVPFMWRLPYTLGDAAFIAGMPDEQRAVVERYVRSLVPETVLESADPDESPLDAAYREGFEDGVEEASDNAANTFPPRRRHRRAA